MDIRFDQLVQCDSPHGLHRNRLEYMHAVISRHTETPGSEKRTQRSETMFKQNICMLVSSVCWLWD